MLAANSYICEMFVWLVA